MLVLLEADILKTNVMVKIGNPVDLQNVENGVYNYTSNDKYKILRSPPKVIYNEIDDEIGDICEQVKPALTNTLKHQPPYIS